MKNSSQSGFWNNKRVLVIGAARQGIALARFLEGRGAHVILNDRKPEAELISARDMLADTTVEWVCGDHPLSLLNRAEIICISGGVPLTLPLVAEGIKRGIFLSNDSQIFLETAQCKTVGITGSAGKTTTTTLVGRIAEAAVNMPNASYRKAWVGGNIGNPLIAHVDDMSVDDLAVLELSSFQLEIMTKSPHVAAILNITPNHLDRHGNMAAYTAAKVRILQNQNREDIAIIGQDDPGAWNQVDKVRGKLITFGFDDPGIGEIGVFSQDGSVYLRKGEKIHLLVKRELVGLRGKHNLMNVIAACAIAWGAGLPEACMPIGVEGFKGVAHRLEFVRTVRGAFWYNDSIATAPERSIAAIRSFDEPLILLSGGRDKDLPWQDFVRVVKDRVRHLIVFGEAAEKILRSMNSDSEKRITITRCQGLKEAVFTAARLAQPGDVILLSPGGTSFDEFRDFEERGECFRRWVMQLPDGE
ncbi:MAG: UDP-N-acetylmuramoyl-L-alanine--D-glutamate ligase [Anaerolineales bacterium]|nr:UDP-N-acetylmuramoyl-L-alanine--D-glutamate ligase [Anaerolineales bacterium]